MTSLTGHLVEIEDSAEDVSLSSKNSMNRNGKKSELLETTRYEETIRYGTVFIPEDGSDKFSFKKLWAFTGPGFLMSIAYLDPGNIESDLTAGAIAKYSLLWILFWSTLMGLCLQLLAARLGVVTGKHLAEICREHYSKKARIALWLMTELAIIASDIQEVIGSAIAISILSNQTIPLWGGVLITAFDTFSFLFLESYGLRKLEVLFATLISIMAITFGIEYVRSTVDQGDVMYGLVVPTIPSNAVEQAVGIIGAVIMPHNIFLHSALVQSRRIDIEDKRAVKEANKYYSIESTIALLVSFVINLFVVAVFATLNSEDPNCGENIDLFSAGDCLKTKYGSIALYVWAVGLLAAGQSSTMTGTYAGQFVMQGFLNLKISPWKRVLLTRSVAIIPAITIAFVAKNGSADLSSLGEWLNVLQSIQLPFALLPVLIFTSSEKWMGAFKNGKALQIFVWLVAVLVMGINVYLIIFFVQTTFPDNIPLYVFTGILFTAYFAFVCYLVTDANWYLLFKRRLFGARTSINSKMSSINENSDEYDDNETNPLIAK